MHPLRTLTAALALAVALASPTAAQAAGERSQLMNRIVDGLSSPDPVTRLVTLEEAMASKDKNLQRIAISTALASSDQSLRTAAVEAAFAAKRSFIVEFTGLARGSTDEVYWQRSGGLIEVRIDKFDSATGDFLAYSPVSFKSRDGVYTASKGNLSGDRLSFDVSVSELSSGNWCRGAVSAKLGETVMVGTMNCNNLGYTIKVDLLR